MILARDYAPIRGSRNGCGVRRCLALHLWAAACYARTAYFAARIPPSILAHADEVIE